MKTKVIVFRCFVSITGVLVAFKKAFGRVLGRRNVFQTEGQYSKRTFTCKHPRCKSAACALQHEALTRRVRLMSLPHEPSLESEQNMTCIMPRVLHGAHIVWQDKVSKNPTEDVTQMQTNTLCMPISFLSRVKVKRYSLVM